MQQCVHVGKRFALFPFGNRLARHMKSLRHLLLGQALFLTFFLNKGRRFVFIHGPFPPFPMRYHIIAMRGVQERKTVKNRGQPTVAPWRGPLFPIQQNLKLYLRRQFPPPKQTGLILLTGFVVIRGHFEKIFDIVMFR